MYALLFTLLLFFLLLFVMDKDKMSLIEGVSNPDSSEVTSSTTYQNYSGSNPMILAEKNAANIQYLQGRLKNLQNLEKEFTSLQTGVTNNKNAIQQIAQLASQHISQTTGIPNTGPPASVQGLSSISNDPSNNLSTTLPSPTSTPN